MLEQQYLARLAPHGGDRRALCSVRIPTGQFVLAPSHSRPNNSISLVSPHAVDKWNCNMQRYSVEISSPTSTNLVQPQNVAARYAHQNQLWLQPCIVFGERSLKPIQFSGKDSNIGSGSRNQREILRPSWNR